MISRVWLPVIILAVKDRLGNAIRERGALLLPDVVLAGSAGDGAAGDVLVNVMVSIESYAHVVTFVLV